MLTLSNEKHNGKILCLFKGQQIQIISLMITKTNPFITVTEESFKRTKYSNLRVSHWMGQYPIYGLFHVEFTQVKGEQHL